MSFISYYEQFTSRFDVSNSSIFNTVSQRNKALCPEATIALEPSE